MLRPIQASDAEPLYQLIKDKAIAQFVALPQPYRRKDMTEFLRKTAKTRKEGSYYLFAIRLYNRPEPIGAIDIHGLGPKSSSCSLGFWLGKPYWNQGIMTQAVKLVIQFCFDRLKLHRVNITHSEGNDGSRRVIEKCWFRREGMSREAMLLHGKWHDVVNYGLLEQEYRQIRDRS